VKTKVETRERRWSLQGKGRAGAIRGVARQLCRHARGKRLAARTRLTQKALGLLHDAPGEQAGVGHVWGEGVESCAAEHVSGQHGAASWGQRLVV